MDIFIRKFLHYTSIGLIVLLLWPVLIGTLIGEWITKGNIREITSFYKTFLDF